MEIPVYVFSGFLESGKTTFIQDALESSEFNSGERTLLLLCEEGEVEYDPDKFFCKNIFIETVDDEKDLTPKKLKDLQLKHKVERVVVEYNGMWMLDSLFMGMPPEWTVAQEMTFFDANTFDAFNRNMRQLTYDKTKSTDLIVVNRCTDKENFDKMKFHKVFRAASRSSQIVYEFGHADVVLDDIEDSLPFDISQDKIVIEDRDYAFWYRDINEEEEKYQGKVIKIKGRSVIGKELEKDKFVFGRHIMTCCIDDVQFGGLVCHYPNAKKKLIHGGWVEITARVKLMEEDLYQGVGPVLLCKNVRKIKPIEPEVATFF